MWKLIAGLAATRAATGWTLFLGLAVAGGLWYAYDGRGDKIAELRLELARCAGNPDQAQIIADLTRQLNEVNQRRANEEIKKLDALPNDCYYLDDPSPLNRLRDPAQ